MRFIRHLCKKKYVRAAKAYSAHVLLRGLIAPVYGGKTRLFLLSTQ